MKDATVEDLVGTVRSAAGASWCLRSASAGRAARQRHPRGRRDRKAHFQALQLRVDRPIDGTDLIRGIGYNEDVGDVGILDDLPRPQTSLPLRRQPGAAEQHLDLRKPRLRLRRIELIRIGPALGSPRPLFGDHETILLPRHTAAHTRTAGRRAYETDDPSALRQLATAPSSP